MSSRKKVMAQNTKRTERSRSHVKVIRKGHLFVLSDLRLLLLNKHKKFEDDAIARFYCSVFPLPRWKQKKQQNTETGSITILTESTSRSIKRTSRSINIDSCDECPGHPTRGRSSWFKHILLQCNNSLSRFKPPAMTIMRSGYRLCPVLSCKINGVSVNATSIGNILRHIFILSNFRSLE